MPVEAKVIADSIFYPPYRDEDPYRLTTMEVNIHRFVLAEFNTHRAFSRSSASSRAIPFAKQLERVLLDPAIPLSWPAEKPGMQGGADVEHPQWAERRWLLARNDAVENAQALADLGVHKSVVNRLIEPFMYHRVIVSSTAWENFFRQRCSPLAQPEIRAAAEAMRSALVESKPVDCLPGEWHAPYVDDETLKWTYTKYGTRVEGRKLVAAEAQKKISVARCARVSYLTHDGIRDPQADLDLYEKLVTADPPHWAPLEHVATPWVSGEVGKTLPRRGNLQGWVQLRQIVEDERGMITWQ